MPDPQPPPSSKRRQRALKRQARRREKRRQKILTGLTDPFAAVMIAYTFAGESETDTPLMLVPTRRLRQHVRQLNGRIAQLRADPSPTPESASSPEPLPPEVGLDAVVEVVPAQRTPRRRNRSSPGSLFPLLPMMPNQQETLAYLLKGSREYPHETGLGRRHRCPICSRSSDPAADSWRSLSVYPTAAGDLVFRCHRCGFCLDSVEFVQRTTYGSTLRQAADDLSGGRLFTAPLSAEQLAGYERLAELRALFPFGRSNFRTQVARLKPALLFGDWALLSVPRLRRIFPELDPRCRLPDDCLARISRDGFGRWSALHLHQPALVQPALPTGTAGLGGPGAADGVPAGVGGPPGMAGTDPLRGEHDGHHDGTGRAALAGRRAAARGARRPLHRDAPRADATVLDACGRCRAAAAVPGLRCPGTRLASAPGAPPATVVSVRRLPDDIGRLDAPPSYCGSRALFCDAATAPECVEDLASMIVAEREHQPLAVAMADVLAQPGIPGAARRRLIELVSECAGVVPEALVPAGFNPWSGGPYALNAAGGTTYIAREGRYWRRGRREKEFKPVTNFVLHLVGHHVDSKGKVTHEARLEIGGRERRIDAVERGARECQAIADQAGRRSPSSRERSCQRSVTRRPSGCCRNWSWRRSVTTLLQPNESANLSE